MREEVIGDATLYLGDCLEAMREIPDNAFDLAIVDPPYGDDKGDWVKNPMGRFQGTRFKKYKTGWDFFPGPEYFAELFRVSRHQIIWGGNYFSLPPSRNFIIWRKLTISESFSMAMAEYAWTNMPGNAKVFECVPQDSARFHPTQKPVALYRWILSLYAKPGDKILDTHMGSGSLEVACAELGYGVTGVEIDEDYYPLACRRIADAYKQPRLFEDEKPKYKQETLGY